MAEGYVNMPISDSVAIRIVGWRATKNKRRVFIKMYIH
jgi:hypothetical protein